MPRYNKVISIHMFSRMSKMWPSFLQLKNGVTMSLFDTFLYASSGFVQVTGERLQVPCADKI